MTADSPAAAGEQQDENGPRSASADRGTDSDAGAPDPEVLLSLRGISKHFGPVIALDRVNLDVPPGRVTALIGDNGAGKSTLIKVIAGIHESDAGEIYWSGERVHIRNPHDATELGVATVYQDLALCDNLDIVANMFLGLEVRKHGILNETPMELKARATLADLSVTTVRSIRQPVGSLSGGQRQSVAVARAIMSDAKLVIMDEPTAALGVTQTAMVLDLIRRLAASGIAVIVISHNLIDVFAVADRVAILYLGRLVSAGPASDYDRLSAVEIMTTGAQSQRENGAAGPATTP
ncbi:MAG TPA: ATP-binding cassette domain-containing protein [Solirubrobacteraceae bacterium]|jgi:ABC-type sugar transport system ATPase subunit